jgi:hypothetical protein
MRGTSHHRHSLRLGIEVIQSVSFSLINVRWQYPTPTRILLEHAHRPTHITGKFKSLLPLTFFVSRE